MDYLTNCHDCFECYDCENVELSKYCSDLKTGEQVSFGNYDVSYFGVGATNCYECVTCGYGNTRVFFPVEVYPGADIYYLINCHNAPHDLFGCIGTTNLGHCVLNKQYNRQEYLALRKKIIHHMKETGEWGEFFPAEFTPYAYNESVEQEYYPLTKVEALSWSFSELSARCRCAVRDETLQLILIVATRTNPSPNTYIRESKNQPKSISRHGRSLDKDCR